MGETDGGVWCPGVGGGGGEGNLLLRFRKINDQNFVHFSGGVTRACDNHSVKAGSCPPTPTKFGTHKLGDYRRIQA